MPYEFLEDTAIADVEFRAWGRDLGEVFSAAAAATLEVMIRNPQAIENRERREIALENEALDLLLFDFLQELIYYKDAQNLLLRVADVLIREDGGYRLRTIAAGERLDATRHEQGVDVKAVTLHRFRLEQDAGGWTAWVILDI